MSKLKLIDSPRLYVNADIAANLKSKLHSPYLKAMAADVIRDADRLVRAKPLKEGSLPTYQPVTRAIDSHLQCLTCAWVLTRKASYRAAALRHLANLASFNQISCEANSTIPADHVMTFCLSYGELSTTVGLMYDLFRADITDAEQEIFFSVLDKFLMKAALKCLDNPPWWANKIWSNWNGVCAGGMGIMALAFYKDIPDAQKLIPFVEGSLGEYFKSYIQNGGGCAEGTGYWNYGMNYAMRYVLSWENATRRKHPALKIKEIGDSLNFPLDFTGVTFGDNDGWGPTCFFFMLAARMNKREAALNAAAYLWKPGKGSGKNSNRTASGDILYASDYIPTLAEMEKLKKSHEKKKVPVARVYKGLDWAALSDDESFPSLRMAVRGGSSAITGHGMIDLLSIRCRVNGELMITDQQDGGYMSSTFTKRGHELYGRSAASKSTIFVDGLPCNTNVVCDKTEVVKSKGLLGIRVDASHAFLHQWRNMFIGRLVLLVDNSYWLVIDHVFSPDVVSHHWLESRFHTLADFKSAAAGVSLKSGKQSMQMTFAALNGGVLQDGIGMPSQPTVPRTVIFRWMGAKAGHDNLNVAALNPGGKKLGLKLSRAKDGIYLIEVKGSGGKTRRIRITSDLELA